MRKAYLPALSAALMLLVGQFSFLNAAEPKFKAHRLGHHQAEACGVADFNNDGKLDIVTGEYLYLAPDWTERKIRTIKSDIDAEGNGYRWDFMDAPLDVDGDGWVDIVSCSWHGKELSWVRNSGDFDSPAKDWESTIVEEKGPYEFGDMVDVDGDGETDEILPICAAMEWAEVGTLPNGEQGLIIHEISSERHVWGGGAGDINGDGRPDLLRPNAWYEAPEDIRKGEWVKHDISLGAPDGGTDHTPQILVHDINGDGRNDILTSTAHKHGIFWYEQQADGSWKQNTIDSTWTQAHSLTLADLDEDGDLDLVTGKRFRAHNTHDPEGTFPPGVYWYEFEMKEKPTWTKHVISFDEGIGSGMNVPVVDIDGDGDLDIVVTGKWGGPVLFENTAK